MQLFVYLQLANYIVALILALILVSKPLLARINSFTYLILCALQPSPPPVTMQTVSVLKMIFVSLMLIVIIMLVFSMNISVTSVQFSIIRINPSSMTQNVFSPIPNTDKIISSTCHSDPVHVVFVGYNFMQAPKDNYKTEPCNVPCEFTKDTRASATKLADAALITLTGYSDHPDKLLEKYHINSSHVLKVGMSMESIVYYPHQFHHISEYDIEMSYRMHSDVPTPYFEFFKYGFLNKSEVSWELREKAVLFVARNCDSRSQREDLVKTLKKYIRVDSISDCLHNKKWPSDISRTDKIGVLKRYVAVLAAENSIADDYVTEKVYDALAAGAVPIYYGAPNVDQFLPSNSAIKVPYPFTEGDIKNVVKQIEGVFNSKVEYNKYFRFKQLGFEEKFVKKFNYTTDSFKCRLCQKIMSLRCHS